MTFSVTMFLPEIRDFRMVENSSYNSCLLFYTIFYFSKGMFVRTWHTSVSYLKRQHLPVSSYTDKSYYVFIQHLFL